MNPHPYTREYFEDAAYSNYGGYQDVEAYAFRAREIASFGCFKRVLEVGCAKGYMVKHLRRLGVQAFGCDISEYAIGEADPEALPYLEIADITKRIPYPDEYFDLVVSYDVLEHIPEDLLPAAAAEMLRVGKAQSHDITCEEYQIGYDATHVTIRPLAWWEEHYPTLNPTMSR